MHDTTVPLAESRLTHRTAVAALPRIIDGSRRIAQKTAELAAAITTQQLVLQGVAEAIATDGHAAKEVVIPPEAYAVRCDIGQIPDLELVITTLLRGDHSLTESDAMDIVFQVGITTLKNTLQTIAIDPTANPLQFYPAGSLEQTA